MFPFEGARETYEEAKRIYSIYGAPDNLKWITGPGGHGNLGPISPQILGFFLHQLKGAPDAPADFTPARPASPQDLLVTPTGQVSTSIGGETIPSIVRRGSEQLKPIKPALAGEIRTLTGAKAIPGGGSLDSQNMKSPKGPGLKPAILMLDSPEHAAEEANRLVKSGWVVAIYEPTPSPPGTEGLKSPYLGSFNLLSLRALLVGRSIVGIQIDDTIKALDLFVARPEVDKSRIAVYGNGSFGMIALHAAVLDSRIRSVMVENTLASYRMVLDQPLHRDISEVMIPGVLGKYDTGGLLLAISPRPVTVITPRDATGAAMSEEQFRSAMDYVFQSKGQSIRVLARSADGQLPLK
jgi:hypothetical protein